MNEEDQVVDDVAEEIEANDGAIETETHQDESVEDRAKRLGWKPKDEYKGKDEWTDAASFMERSENDPAVMRKSLRSIERNYSKLEKTTEAILQHQQRQLEEARKQGYAQARADIEKRHLEAVEAGDAEAAQKAWKAREVIDERERQETNTRPANNSNHDAEIVSGWMEKNSWYKSDPRLRAAAKQIENELALDGVPLEERLERTSQLVMEEFPNKFQKRQTRQAPMMGQGNNNGIARGRPKPGSYEALNPDAQAECDRSVKGSNGKISKEDWIRYATPDMFQ